MTLKYPKELSEGSVDYVVFKSFEYRTNQQIPGGVGNESGPSVGEDIVLYMPPTTPAVGNMNNWNMESFEGPLGALGRNLAVGASDAVMSIGEPGGFSGENDVGARLQAQIQAATSGAGDAAQHFGLNVVAGFAGTKANTLLALSKGKIFNPNIEMIYNGPQLRAFTFDFVFAPKSAEEAQIVNSIIKEFKVRSSPEQEGGFFRVPNVWEVTYMSGSSQNKNMNTFKKAALTGISIQDNSGMNMYMSYADGVPITTSMNLQFSEVDIITREDHLDDERSSNRGY